MSEKTCELCGYEGEIGTVKNYRVFPQEIIEQVGIQHSKIIRLCPNCQQELETWYATNVAHMTYNNGMKQFRAKSPEEMLKEYETAYRHFTEYKKEQQRLL